MAQQERPEGLTDDVLFYLDILRETGVTNMYGAGPYVEEEFDVSCRTANEWVGYWMRTFGQDDR